MANQQIHLPSASRIKREEQSLSLKAVVDREKNKVLFVESDSHFVDFLLSFLTIPIGSVISLAQAKSIPITIGSIKNVHQSVENLDIKYFRFHSEKGKFMLLRPRNGAESYCCDLQLRFDFFAKSTEFFRCSEKKCTQEVYKMLSPYEDVLCKCNHPMNSKLELNRKLSPNMEPKGVFVKVNTNFLITDELQVMPVSTSATFSLLSKLGYTDQSNLEEISFDVKADEVLKLIISSLVSKSPFTEVLLKNNSIPSSISPRLYYNNLTVFKKEEESLTELITLKLVVSKSAKRVCYAEANSDFVDLVFSFLAVPLGNVARKMSGANCFSGSINNLHNTVVQDLDEKLFKSSRHKEILVNPMLAFGFSDENDLFGINEAFHPLYYYGQSLRNNYSYECLTTDKSQLSSVYSSVSLSVINPLAPCTESDTDSWGIVAGPTTKFMVTDSLVVTPLSASSCLTILKELNVPFRDIEEKVVHIRKIEVSRLLMSSFASECALTSAFL